MLRALSVAASADVCNSPSFSLVIMVGRSLAIPAVRVARQTVVFFGFAWATGGLGWPREGRARVPMACQGLSHPLKRGWLDRWRLRADGLTPPPLSQTGDESD